jgi:hypothetical protein
MGSTSNGRLPVCGKFPEVGSKKGQYWKWVPLLEMGMPFPLLVSKLRFWVGLLTYVMCYGTRVVLTPSVLRCHCAATALPLRCHCAATALVEVEGKQETVFFLAGRSLRF